MKTKKHYLILLLSFCFILVYGQNMESHTSLAQDSLLQKTYSELEHYFNEIKYDFAKAEIYAKTYLKKAVADKDTIRQANAYYFLSTIETPAISEKYADAIITLTEKLNNDIYPAGGFLAKAIALQRMGKYKNALDQVLEANTYAVINNNIPQQMEVNYLMGILKTDLGKYKEALNIFREYFNNVKKKYNEDESYFDKYMKALFVLGDAYNRNSKYDSAITINRKGYDISLKNKDSLGVIYFTLSIGITAYHKKNYGASLDSLRKAANVLMKTSDTGNLTICYLYIGKTYEDRGEINKAIPYFKKVDIIVEKTSDVFPEITDAYKSLKNYYGEKKDAKNKLKYLDRFLHIDSLLDINYKYSSEIIKKYDTEKLKHEKDELINKQKSANKTLKSWIISLSIIVLLISVFTLYYYKKQLSYRIKFEALLNKKDEEKEKTKTGATTIAALDISEKALNNITEKLKTFIEEKQFLSNTVSLNELAKAMDTNPNYLSRFINFYEQKNFSAYIKDLRINYAVQELKTNAIFRKYSIKAIAEELGFNNEQSFSKAFYKKTGIYPSYFIKELEKEALRKRSA